MPKFYVTDGDNQFLIDTNTHLQACQKALKNWGSKQKAIGKFLSFGNTGFENINTYNKIETKIVKGLDFDG